jgi:hypothetical protein
MPLPANITRIKVHPAIGVARVSTGDGFYVYGEQPDEYHQDGKMRRQAVQFRLFAYADGNVGIEELTPQRLNALGLEVVWHAHVANRKIQRQRGASFLLEAHARSDVKNGKLVGTLNGFLEGVDIELGEIRSDGIFIPPKAAVFKETATTQNTGALHQRDISDNAGDGFVTATLIDPATGQPVAAPVLGAYLLIAPQDFSPELDDPDEYPGRQHLYDWLLDQTGRSNVVPAEPVNAAARQLDRDALERCTTDFAPGIEMFPFFFPSLDDVYLSASEVGDPNELRVARRLTPFGPGVDAGEFTSGLCSPWQNDFLACTCFFWAAQRPDSAFADESSPARVKWLRKQVADQSSNPISISTPGEIIQHVDKLGVVRVRNNRHVETERTEDIP